MSTARSQITQSYLLPVRLLAERRNGRGQAAIHQSILRGVWFPVVEVRPSRELKQASQAAKSELASRKEKRFVPLGCQYCYNRCIHCSRIAS